MVLIPLPHNEKRSLYQVLPGIGTPPPHNRKGFTLWRTDAQQLNLHRPSFGTWGSLTLDTTITLYLITPFLFFYSIFYTTGSPEV